MSEWINVKPSLLSRCVISALLGSRSGFDDYYKGRRRSISPGSSRLSRRSPSPGSRTARHHRFSRSPPNHS